MFRVRLLVMNSAGVVIQLNCKQSAGPEVQINRDIADALAKAPNDTRLSAVAINEVTCAI